MYWQSYLVLLVGLTLLIAYAQLSRSLGLLHHHHLEAGTCQPLCILMVVLLWKATVGLLALQTTVSVKICFHSVKNTCCLDCQWYEEAKNAIAWASERFVKLHPKSKITWNCNGRHHCSRQGLERQE